MNDFISYLSKHFSKHQNFKISLSALELIEDLQQQDSRQQSREIQLSTLSITDPVTDLPVLNHSQITKEFIEELSACVRILMAIEDKYLKKYTVHGFLSNINDSTTGSLEVRLRPALQFVALYKSREALHINDLMQQYVESIQLSPPSVENVLNFFARMIDHRLPVVHLDNRIEPINWKDVQNYMKDCLCTPEIEAEWYSFGKNNAPLKIGNRCYFSDKESAQLYLAYVKSIMPQSYQQELALTRIKKYDDEFYFVLSLEQQSQLALAQNSHNVQPKLIATPRKQTNKNPIDLSKDSWLVKSIRWDKCNFIDNFLRGVTKSENRPHKEALRKTGHEKYTVFASGAYPYAQKPSPYPYAGEELKIRKAKRSQHQSTSLITEKLRSPVFGFNKNGNVKLVGFVFDASDALINRIFRYDNGTFYKPYEKNTYYKALQYHQAKVNPDYPVLFSSLEDLEKTMVKHPKSHNEVTARIRYKTRGKNIRQSGIGIFSDNLESRCIAQYYAKQTLFHLEQQYRSKNKNLDASYQPPIVHYLPGEAKDNQPYTAKEQKQDQKTAKAILNNQEAYLEKFQQNKFEFLLLIPSKMLIDFLEQQPNVLQNLFQRQQWHIIQALITISKNPSRLIRLIKPYAKNHCIANVFECRQLALAQLLLKHCQSSITKALAHGQTPIFLAASHGYLDLVNNLIKQGVDPNRQGKKTNPSPLWIAVQNGHVKIADLLLQHGAQVNQRATKKHPTCLSIAVNNGQLKMIDCLMNYGADANQKNQDNIAPIFIAAEKGEAEIIKALTKNGANVNRALKIRDDYLILNRLFQTRQNAYTPLHIAAANNHPEAIKALIEGGAQVNYADNYGESSLYVAARQGKLKALQVLIEYGADLNQMDELGRTPIYIAAKHGHLEIVKALLKHRCVDLIASFVSQGIPSALSKDKDLIEELHLQLIEQYLNTICNKVNDSDQSVLNETNKNILGFSFFSYSAKENHDAAQAFKNLVDGSGDKQSLNPHKGALNQGKLGEIYQLYRNSSSLTN